MTTTLPRRVGVFTSTRADSGPLGPVIDACGERDDLKVIVLATGAHLSRARGDTLEDLRTVLPGSVALDVINAPFERTATSDLAHQGATLFEGTMAALTTHALDAVVMLGDRWELLPAATAALLSQVPIVHLHGGEITEGALDDRVRHAMTKLADLHCCATEDAKLRILQMGEEPERVLVTGAPSLDRLAGATAFSDRELEQLLGAQVRRPLALATYHPPTVDRRAVGERAEAVLSAAAEETGTVVVTAPGADPGGDDVIAAIDRVLRRRANVQLIPSMGAHYPRMLASADLMIGNSSSGILEAASFALPVVNVGQRQQGRLQPANVVNTGEDGRSVRQGIRRALEPTFVEACKQVSNPYGDGHAGVRIAAILAESPLIVAGGKRFVDLR